MTIHNLNEHRAAAQQRKADALRTAVKDVAVDALRQTTGDPTAALSASDLHDLADAAWLGRDRAEMWAELAVRAGVNPPGSSSGDPRRVVAIVARGLRDDADALDAEHDDPVLIAQLQASLDAVRAG